MLTSLYIFLIRTIKINPDYLEWLEYLCEQEDHFRGITERIKRIVSYIPVLWKLHDFDYTSALKVYSFQLKRVENAMINGYAIHNKKLLRRLKEYILRIERLETNYDEEILLDEYSKKFPQIFDWEYISSNRPKNTKPEKELAELNKKVRHIKQEHWKLIDTFNRKYIERCWD